MTHAVLERIICGWLDSLGYLCAIVSKRQYQSGASRFTYVRRFYNLRLGRLSYVERYVMSPDTAIVEPWQTGLISRLAGAVKL